MNKCCIECFSPSGVLNCRQPNCPCHQTVGEKEEKRILNQLREEVEIHKEWGRKNNCGCRMCNPASQEPAPVESWEKNIRAISSNPKVADKMISFISQLIKEAEARGEEKTKLALAIQRDEIDLEMAEARQETLAEIEKWVEENTEISDMIHKSVILSFIKSKKEQ